ncbi:MAG: Stk1 family PASTA domain-containing Ser/Thr kinase [Oscillospiraceae bacterium]|nr:Stk1 family PASTA domain-containing Ser/Thr kinase [Oscillospiraceae bacterium]
MDQYIGRLLDDRYEILELIGTGGMAVVYKARCHRLNRLVAIKILKDEFSQDEEFRRRFHAEGEAVAMLSHPNIVQVYDVSSTDNANFIVMELIDGISLKQYMEKKGVLNWKETLHFAMQIAKGLEHAHSRGIIHRDIKPHNVMVLKNGSVKVMDFGIARVMSKSNTLTKEALGSVHYISPEQAKGGHTDNRSDLYSLSVVMYEMMTGRPPYDGESPVAVAIQHINGGAAMPSTLNPNIPGGLEQIIMKGMALELQDRYVSATEMLQDMEEFRKNPAILFHYRTIIDSSTRPITVVSDAKPRTTADKVVQAKTGTRIPSDSMRLRTDSDGMWVRKQTAGTPGSPAGAAKKRTGNGAGSNTARNREAAEAARRAQQRRAAQERQREEEERSRVATVAIVICSAVAILAIVLFLFALFNGVLLNKTQEIVKVPELVGQVYSDYLAQELDDFTIQLLPQQYNDKYEKGHIMHQEPAGGTEVKKGTDIWITISMGEEPEVKIMDDYVGFRQEEVKSALEGQGFRPIFSPEPSAEYPEGVIIRTDPVARTELEEGQAIKIYVSSGPDVQTAKMINVVGEGKERAVELLKTKGFEKVRTITVESEETAGTVVYQSETAGEEIDVNTEILLEISQGPAETQAPATTQPPEQTPEPTPTETQGNWSVQSISFALPVRDTSYTVVVYRDGVPITGEYTINPGTDVFSLGEVEGYGTVIFDLVIDGVVYSSKPVEF